MEVATQCVKAAFCFSFGPGRPYSRRMSSLLAFLAPVFLSPAPLFFLQLDETQIEAPPEEAQEAPVPLVEPGEEPAAPQAQAPSAEEVALSASINGGVREREDVRVVHRAFGVATWLSMAVSLIVGGLHFHDEYGFGGPADTPCARFQPIQSQDFCGQNIAVPMLTSGLITSALYYTTFTLSFMMPDPLGVADSPGWAGERLRIHKALRWAHFAGMLATTIFGFIAGAMPQGPDGVPFDVRRAMAGVHLGLGTATYALLTAAAVVILF